MPYPGTGFKTSCLDVFVSGNTGRDFFSSRGIRPNIPWLCLNIKTKGDWVKIEIHISVFLIVKGSEDIKSQPTCNRNKSDYSKGAYFDKNNTQGHKGCPHALPLPAHHSVQPLSFHPPPPTHTCPFVCSHPSAVRRHLWWHQDTVLLPYFQLRALWLLESVKPNPP